MFHTTCVPSFSFLVRSFCWCFQSQALPILVIYLLLDLIRPSSLPLCRSHCKEGVTEFDDLSSFHTRFFLLAILVALTVAACDTFLGYRLFARLLPTLLLICFVCFHFVNLLELVIINPLGYRMPCCCFLYVVLM